MKLSETGYDRRKIPVRGEGVPDKPMRVRLQTGPLSCSVKGSCKPVARAVTYEVQISPNPVSGEWVYAGSFTDSRNFLIEGLERGKDVFIRVRALGANGTSPWGGKASVMVV